MGFNLEYLSDGTVKGVLDLKNIEVEGRCLRPKISPKVADRKNTVCRDF